MSLKAAARATLLFAGLLGMIPGATSVSFGQSLDEAAKSGLLEQLRQGRADSQDAGGNVGQPSFSPQPQAIRDEARQDRETRLPSRLEGDYVNRISVAAPDAVPLEVPPQSAAETPGGLSPQAATSPFSGISQPQGMTVAPAGMPDQQTTIYPQVGSRQGAMSRGHRVLSQFGYDMFRRGADVTSGVMGAVADNYVLGVGDEIVVTLRGQRNATRRASVDRNGQVIVPDLTPVSAAGRRFGEVRDEIKAQAESKFLQTEAFISVGRVRSIVVYLLGEVGDPGPHRLTGLSGLMEAIAAGGGIRKTGSLRSVRLVRGNSSRTIDLYDLIFTGRLPGDLELADGDKIFVPPLASTLAVAGEVRRPGIYEIKDSRVSVRDALALAGGGLRAGGYRYLRISTDVGGRDQATDIGHALDAPLGNGDILLVLKSKNSEIGGFMVDGHVVAPGVRSIAATPTLRTLLADPSIIKDNPYLIFGVLQRTDEVTRARIFSSVDLTRVRNGQTDVALRQNDRLIVLGMDDVRYLSSDDVQSVLLGRRPLSLASAAPGKACGGLKALSALYQTSSNERFANALEIVSTGDSSAEGFHAKKMPVANVVPCPEVFEKYPELLPFVLDHAVTVQGEANVPGVYPVGPATSLASLIAEVGGLSRDADLSNIEISHFNDPRQGPRTHHGVDGRRLPLQQVELYPGDNIRFNPIFLGREVGPVAIRGEVKRPGFYNIFRGEKLSDLIERAGGLTDQAYPLGTIFTRKSLKDQERQANEQAAAKFQSQLGSAVAKAGPGDDRTKMLAALQPVVDGIRNAPVLGRLAVEGDPAILSVKPEKDTMLEAGDDVFVPKRPNTVTVIGEVLNPGSVGFDAANDPRTYIEMAGGMTQAADEGRVYVILPNGQAQHAKVSSWNLVSTPVPPGSIVVVPRDAEPFNAWAFTKDLFSIASQLAISAASLAVVSNY